MDNPALTSVNPLLIDLNDFQFLMPPIQYFPSYTEKSVDRICTDLEKGQIRQSEFPSYVIQAHIPYIAPGDLVNVYPLFRGLCPLEPWHVNGVSNPAKCPPDIPTEHLLID